MIIFIVPKNSGLVIYKEIIGNFDYKEILEVRGEDVPLFVSNLIKQGKKVIGITGEDLLKEFLLRNKNTGIFLLKRIIWNNESYLFKKPTLCLLGPKNKKLEELSKNLKVCINRKYQKITNKYCINNLISKGFQIEKIYASGATEEFFSNEIVDLVIDVVCSGSSAEKYGLEVYDKIFSSDIVVIGGKNDN